MIVPSEIVFNVKATSLTILAAVKVITKLVPKEVEAPKEEEAKQEEDEMKSILSGLLALKSNQDALNRRLFEVTGKR